MLFKNIGEQEEGMKLYSQCIMASKTMKQMDSVIQKVYTTSGLVSEHFASMS